MAASDDTLMIRRLADWRILRIGKAGRPYDRENALEQDVGEESRCEDIAIRCGPGSDFPLESEAVIPCCRIIFAENRYPLFGTTL